MSGGGDLGLSSPGDESSNTANVIELPPKVTRVNSSDGKEKPSTESNQIQEFASSDPDMNMYRKMALTEYQLAG